jgi:putative Mg2+ transporter-C (MgtC) family protein
MNITELEWAFRIIISGILSGIIGWERERHGKGAGFRTLILVGMGSCLAMVTSLRVYELFSAGSATVLRIDPARIAYGVLTGIGFLGAGTIIRDRDGIRGLTTASCLWVVSSLGLAVGCGHYYLSLITTAATLLTLLVLKKVEMHVARDAYSELKIIFAGDISLIDRIASALRESGCEILAYRLQKNRKSDTVTARISLRHKNVLDGISISRVIERFPEVTVFEWT